MPSPSAVDTLSRLIYASRAQRLFSMHEFMDILRKSQENNLQNGLTGVLAYGDGHFMQTIEGDRRLVSQTYSRIVKDDRHCDVELLEFSGCSERYFSAWSMQHQCVRTDILTRLGIQEAFRPHHWTADKCIHFAIRYSMLLNASPDENSAKLQLA
jgi:hypothetical protein